MAYRTDETGMLLTESHDTFCSGVHNAAEWRGIFRGGFHPGLVATAIPEALWEEVELGGWSGGRVFIDSGAFSEVAFGKDGPKVVRPMTEATWAKVLAAYLRAAKFYGPNAWVVAPDQVGNQAVTLERLARYAPELRQLHELGANIIVPMQRGELEPHRYVARVTKVLGFSDWVAGVPLKKAATSLEELCAIVEALPLGLERLHLLGISPSSPRFEEVVATIRLNASPFVQFTSDAVRTRALAGRTNGRGGGPRAITAARDALAAQGVTVGAELKERATRQVFAALYDAEVEAAKAAGWRDLELEPGEDLQETTDTDIDQAA